MIFVAEPYMEEYKKNIISWDLHNCYDNCIVRLNNNPIKKSLLVVI